ncbi:type I-E CRISPR-associated protein Cse1/CasA [Meiothermus sp. QL-1]|uniref:type I-E CRISPR-associated protein Cse1/CasA n=1 Tax=Meiothermus sp. QL-1 TaxID=2058095 RepID=UPI0018F22063|nr:type I-E CRISPR-associated protein Cse1/CasA [Meiothermus sp. QL-1]
MAKFNLLEEPWIPVLEGGQVREVSLREALFRATSIERIETPSPLEEAALHRLLLAVLYRAAPPRDLDEALDLLGKGGFDRGGLDAYLNTHQDRFFLFHDTTPFLQIADLPDQDPLPWSKLLPELSNGNNPTLFDHTLNSNPPTASYAQAARALVVHQTFAPGESLWRLDVPAAKDAPLARPAAFLVTGRNLFETLVLNLVPQRDPGKPIWEQPPLCTKDVEGYATQWPLEGAARVYTWPARGVRLLDQGNGVRFMAYGPGVMPQDVGWRDPMVAYRQKNKTGQILTLRLSMEKSFWRDFGAMLPGAGGSWPAALSHAAQVATEVKLIPSIRVLGQVSGLAKMLDIRREVYPLPPGLISPKGEALLQRALELAEELGQRLQTAAWRLAQEVLGTDDRRQLQAFRNSLPLLRLYWAELDGSFPRFLEALNHPGAMDLWREELKKAARRAWEETRRSLGTQARHLKALVRGEETLGAALAAL